MKNLILLMASTLLSVAILEIGLRLFTEFPISYYSNTIPDEILGHRMNPKLEGIDKAGFRNDGLVDRPYIVTLGDSHTYGFNVAPEYSWPLQLARMIRKPVSNFGVGGYGILQFKYLVGEVIKLRPKYIILGLYLPNDLNDVCQALGENDFWKTWAKENDVNVELCPNDTFSTVPEHKSQSVRAWINQNTAIGSILKHVIWVPFLSVIKTNTPISNLNDAVVVKEWEIKTIIGYQRIINHADYMDVNKPHIAMALKIAKEFMVEAKKSSESNDVTFTVLFIPSKETVLYSYLIDKGYQLPDNYHRLVKNERRLVDAMSAFLKKLGVPNGDALPYLEDALSNFKNVYTTRDDGHPLEIGYKAYAETAYAIVSGGEEN